MGIGENRPVFHEFRALSREKSPSRNETTLQIMRQIEKVEEEYHTNIHTTIRPVGCSVNYFHAMKTEHTFKIEKFVYASHFGKYLQFLYSMCKFEIGREFHFI